MRFHLVSVPGRPVTRLNSRCALTQSVRKLANMMVGKGHEVFVYGEEEHDHKAEHVACFPEVNIVPDFTVKDWEPFMALAVPEIKDRLAGDRDIICVTGADCAVKIWDEFPDNIKTEPAVAYAGPLPDTHKAFESYAWRHTIYGRMYGADSDGKNFDTVIYPSLDVPRKKKLSAVRKDGYFLYLGRMVERKGIQECGEMAQRADVPLILAGADGDVRPSYGEWLGPVGPDQRDELLSNATALLAPTRYIEPGHHTSIEAQMFGTPVISTDWGAFTETVEQGVTGYRCSTLAEFVKAIKDAPDLDREAIRERAISRYSSKVISKQYDAWFKRLLTLKEAGWYA
jgi:glycosyltransferase involved in cell wall biosynthesis